MEMTRCSKNGLITMIHESAQTYTYAQSCGFRKKQLGDRWLVIGLVQIISWWIEILYVELVSWPNICYMYNVLIWGFVYYIVHSTLDYYNTTLHHLYLYQYTSASQVMTYALRCVDTFKWNKFSILGLTFGRKTKNYLCIPFLLKSTVCGQQCLAFGSVKLATKLYG